MNEINSGVRQVNYRIMRAVIGGIALLLSLVVSLLAGSQYELTSISISYWTDSHDVFVGALVVVSFFFFVYNGSGKGRDREYVISKFACVFALGIALFPTKGYTSSDIPAQWVQSVAGLFGTTPVVFHYISAVLLFVCIIALMWFFSLRAAGKGKHRRALFYKTVAILIVGGIVVLYLLGRHFEWTNSVLLIEVWGLSWFGFGWLVAGLYTPDTAAN